MPLAISVTLDYALDRPEPVLLTLGAARTAGQKVLSESLEAGSARVARMRGPGGVGERAWVTPDNAALQVNYIAEVAMTRSAPSLDMLDAHPVHELPAEVLDYIRPSRFVEPDLLGAFAESRFGDLAGGKRVNAISGWVAGALTYASGASGPVTTAIDTFVARRGVCRDYAHLTAALVRASGIPARYVSCYAPRVKPQDFHAVTEVWLEGDWHLVDATGMAAPAETVVIASGRDAADVAFMETEHAATLKEQTVTVTSR